LFSDLPGKADCVWSPAAGVDDDELPASPLAFVGDAVTGDAGEVLNYGITTAN
jgi:hypothetical protein